MEPAAGRTPRVHASSRFVWALAGAVFLLAVNGCASPSPSATTSPGQSATSTVGTSSSTPTAASGGPRITWSEQSFEGTINAVTTDSGQWVAVGRTDDELAAWTSPDGVTWERHPVPQPRPDQILPNFPGDEASFLNLMAMGPLARLGDTLYSIGTFGNFIDFVRPLGWRSVDGTRWEFIESESAFFSYGTTQELAASDTGLLAARGGGYGMSGWLWTPEASWTETGLASSPESRLTILDASWSDNGFIAVGVRAEGEPSTDPQTWPTSAASWVSIDGKNWQAAPSSSGLEMAIMWAVTPMPAGGYVAVGCAECSVGHPGGAGFGPPAAWTSPDGVNWTQVPLPSQGDGEALGVVAVDNGFVAAGVVGDDTLTWTSDDGTTWRAGTTLAGRFQPKTLAASEEAVVLVVSRGMDPEGSPSETVLMRAEVQP